MTLASKFKPNTLQRVLMPFKLLVSKLINVLSKNIYKFTADDEVDEGEGETVINIVDAH